MYRMSDKFRKRCWIQLQQIPCQNKLTSVAHLPPWYKVGPVTSYKQSYNFTYKVYKAIYKGYNSNL